MAESIDHFKGRYACFSNFHPATVKWEGLVYPTTEHAFQAAKTWDEELREEIAELRSPGAAKRFGRRVPLRPDWDEARLSIMGLLVCQKFTIHEEMRRLLLSTGDRRLIEGNNWGDRYWGMEREENPDIAGSYFWMGENHLGVILMAVRDGLRLACGEVGQPVS